MQHFDGARLSPNSVRNAVWHALNEPVCRYLRKRNPRCSTVYIDNSLGPLARDSPCIKCVPQIFYFSCVCSPLVKCVKGFQSLIMFLFVSSLNCLGRCILHILKHGSGSREYTHLGVMAKYGVYKSSHLLIRAGGPNKEM
jgi:hypothetical protein